MRNIAKLRERLWSICGSGSDEILEWLAPMIEHGDEMAAEMRDRPLSLVPHDAAIRWDNCLAKLFHDLQNTSGDDHG
jgi:hypothetical protein